MVRAVVGAAVAGVIAAGAVGVAARQAGGVRTVFVSVVDNKGVPIPDLTAADFTVKEDGKTRPVTTAEVSKVPMSVALLLDDSGLGLQSIREGAAGFVNRMRGVAEISITTTGGRNIKLQDFTDSPATLIGAINRVFARNQSGSYLVEGLVDAAESVAKREARRPVVLSIGVEGDELSSLRANEALAGIQRTGAQIYLVRLGRPVIGRGNALEAERGESMADEAIQANSVFGQAPARSGGKIEQISQNTGIPKIVDQIATELLGQYAITYSSANVSAPDLKFQVETSRKGAKVRAQNRVGPPK